MEGDWLEMSGDQDQCCTRTFVRWFFKNGRPRRVGQRDGEDEDFNYIIACSCSRPTIVCMFLRVRPWCL